MRVKSNKKNKNTKKMKFKTRLKKGDLVRVLSGKDKGRDGRILLIDRKKLRVIVEGINIIKKHQKPNASSPQGGIVEKEAPMDISKVIYLHKGVPTKIGYKFESIKKDGKDVLIKKRFAKKTGELID